MVTHHAQHHDHSCKYRIGHDGGKYIEYNGGKFRYTYPVQQITNYNIFIYAKRKRFYFLAILAIILSELPPAHFFSKSGLSSFFAIWNNRNASPVMTPLNQMLLDEQ